MLSIVRRSILGAFALMLSWQALAQDTDSASHESQQPRVQMETSLGSLTIELYPDKAPETVSNFLSYVDEGFYNGTIFHRVIPGFMVQGGQMTPDMASKETRAPIKNESGNGLKNLRGTLAMARTMQAHSATSQFFVNLVDNTHLDARPGTPGYAVFGKVVDGMEVIDKIAQARTGFKQGHENVPVEPILIQKAQRLQ